MSVARALGTGAWVLALLAGCAGLEPPRVGDRAPQVSDRAEESHYQQLLRHFSDHAEAYAGFDSRMFCAATLQTWAFREARTRRLALFQQQPSAVLEQHLAEERAELDSGNDVVFGVHTSDPHWNDFDSKKSIWRVALRTATGEYTPVEVVLISRSTPNLRALYPYVDEFWTAYRFRFPKVVNGTPVIPDGEPTVTLKVSSTLATADLTLAVQ